MKKIRQISALITIILIIGLIVGTVICAIKGSPYFLGMFCLSIIVPVVLWVFMWFTRLIYGDSQMDTKEESDDKKGNGAG